MLWLGRVSLQVSQLGQVHTTFYTGTTDYRGHNGARAVASASSMPLSTDAQSSTVRVIADFFFDCETKSDLNLSKGWRKSWAWAHTCNHNTCVTVGCRMRPCFQEKRAKPSIVFYGGLKENSPHRFIYLNAWSSAGSTVWEELGGVAFWKCVSGGGLWCFKRSLKAQSFSLSFSCW